MFNFTYISDVCNQKQIILSYFNAPTIYWWCNVPFNNRDKAMIKNLNRFKKYSFRKILAEFLKINCNRESENAISTDLRNMQHRPKAWDRQTEACTYWRKRDNCG